MQAGSARNLQTGVPSFDIVVGVSSFGEQTCQKSGGPEVFTSVPEFSAWIAGTVRFYEEGQSPEAQVSLYAQRRGRWINFMEKLKQVFYMWIYSHAYRTKSH